MAHLIEEIAERLQEVNRILALGNAAGETLFNDVQILTQFYHDYKNTNSIIDVAEELAHNSINNLYEQVTKLKESLQRFCSLDLGKWRNVDFVAIEQAHGQDAKRKWDVARDKATTLWKQFQADSNRLDMMPLDSEEYRQLDERCEQDKQAYEEASKMASLLYNLYQQDMEVRARIHYFEVRFLELWASKTLQIAEAIRRDVERLMKEDPA